MTDFKEISARKQALRQEVLARRAALGPGVRKMAAREVIGHALALGKLEEASRVALYWPIRDELDTRSLIEELAGRGKSVGLPVIRGRGEVLDFRLFGGAESLRPAPFGTLEPSSEMAALIPEIIFLPLAGFDGTGTRLGYGKGFYDRTIAAMAQRPLLIGLAFGRQELDFIPFSPHDERLDGVITEQGVRWFGPAPETKR